MLNWRRIAEKSNNNKFRWTLDWKIGGLASVLLILLGGVSCYFYFEMNEISRELEEISQSDIPIYKITNQLILAQQKKKLLLEELNKLYGKSIPHNFPEEQGFYLSKIAYRFEQLEQNISKSLAAGIKQSELALKEEEEKEDKYRLNQEQEDYQQLKSIFLQLELEEQKINLIIEQYLQEVVSNQTATSRDLIQQARLELQVFEQLTQEILRQLEAHIDGSVLAVAQEKENATKNTLYVSCTVLLFGLFFSIWLTNKITSSIKKITRQAQSFADNIEELTFKPEALVIETNDELQDLSVAFNRMVDNFILIQIERKKRAEQVLSEKELAQWQASHDSLTDLVNRREFEHQLSQTLENEVSQSHSLLYLDLDRFKIVNDTCGHNAGDELLRQVSKVLQSQIRSSDTLARLGGDEFAIILYGSSEENAVAIAQKILNGIQQFCFIWQEKSFTIGVSIGVVSFKSQQDTLSSILKVADAACYSAKNLGRNQIYVMENREQKLAHQSPEINWLAEIHQALDLDRFVLFYQTIKPLQTDSDQCEHYEVLLRMAGENGEIIPPMAFIPMAERYQLMNQLDRWVIRTLFATQGAHFRKRGRIARPNSSTLHSLYSINLSQETLNDATFVQFLQEELELHQIPPQLICFEITETVAISNLAQAQLMITQLQELGCRLALDDFGGGMSSFSCLKSLKVDFIKIDSIFIQQLLEDSVNSLILKYFHQIAQEMGIATIAECVDSQEKLIQLKSLGINYAQGNAIRKPQPLPKLQLLTPSQNIA